MSTVSRAHSGKMVGDAEKFRKEFIDSGIEVFKYPRHGRP
jgi:hypothetical protein